MTQTADLPLPSARASETRLIVLICAAHFVSHYYIILLAPLFIFVRADYGVTYTELGFALMAFNIVSAVFQTPAGFLADRVGPRAVLIAGLILGAAAFAVAGLVNSFWVFVAMFGVAGLANTVYHPADYALLSQYVSSERMSQAFSFHTFSGLLGGAVAPASLLFMHSMWGWRGAFIGAAVLGFVVALVLVWQGNGRHPPPVPVKATGKDAGTEQGWRMLLAPLIVLNFFFFILLSITGSGLNNFLVVALGALHGTPPALGNTALTGILVMSAIGVLIGGVLATRIPRHGLIAGLSLLVVAVTTWAVAMADPGALLLVMIFSIGGLASGIAMPSRDMIVRAVTPPGAFGRVFGFVTTGFNIGGMISPLIFGLLLDYNRPREIFLFIAACALISIVFVAVGRTRKAPA